MDQVTALDNVTYDVMFVAAFSGGMVCLLFLFLYGKGGGGGGGGC